MSTYLLAAHLQLRKFCAYEIRQIPRTKNSHDDALARLVSAINDKIDRQVPVEILTQPSIIGANVCDVQYENTWLSPIYLYLTNGTIPNHKTQARKLRYRSARYTITNDVLKCITAEQEDYVLLEIHGGICSDHSGSRLLAHKAF
ncbi:unnamed protein product [Prunus armeniaca]